MSQTVAGSLVDVLEKIGVKQIFGLIGDSLNPLADGPSGSIGALASRAQKRNNDQNNSRRGIEPHGTCDQISRSEPVACPNGQPDRAVAPVL